ncbi:MAG: stage V sporulation protein G [Planctomycetes bacterium]|nr:stage V sporulation protein G [Planctomycetota bacterium]
MQISEIRIKLVGNRTDRLKAFSSVTFDNSFVVRDLKIIEGADGYFVAMPSRKLMDRCNGCGSKNHLRAKFCNECGTRLDENRSRKRGSMRTKMHADVAHPINSESREYIQKEVVKSFTRELDLSQQPGYQAAEIDEYHDEHFDDHEKPAASFDSPAVASETTAPEEEPSESPETSESKQDDSGFGEGIV